MGIDVKSRTEIINQLNSKIEEILKLDDSRLQPDFKNKLITPLWSFSKESIKLTIKHYESILLLTFSLFSVSLWSFMKMTMLIEFNLLYTIKT